MTRKASLLGAHSSLHSAVLSVAVLFAAPNVGWGQIGAASLDRSIITATSSLSPQQQSQLERFTEEWTTVLADAEDSRRLEEARRVLIEPLRDPGATAVFRRSSSQIVTDRLGEVIAGGDLQRAIHAMQVVRFLRTPESIDLLLSRLPSDRESDPGKRLSAAGILAAALSDADLGQIQFDAASRAIAAASERENNSLVILQNLKALAAIQRRSGVPAASADLARSSQAQVLRGFVGSIVARTEADERMGAVGRALVALRNQWLEIARADAAKLGPMLAPSLTEILAAAAKHWESAQQNPALKQTYASTIANAETLLRIIDRSARPTAYRNVPDNQPRVMDVAWEKGDRQAFDAELARWQQIVGAAPYR